MENLNLKSRIKDQETVSTIALFFLCIASITSNFYFMYTAMGLLVIALFIRTVANKIAWGWLAFAKVLGEFNSMVVLTLVYYIVLTPIAMLYRIFNKNTLGVVASKDSASYFTVRNHLFSKENLEKMW